MMNEFRAAPEIAHLLADPLRFSIMQFLTWGGCSVAKLVQATGASQPNVSNHLKLLREGNMVIAEKQGRQTFYRVASPDIAEAVAALCWAGRGAGALNLAAGAGAMPEELEEGRTCYDHLAGWMGIKLMSELVKAAAITEPAAPWAGVELGPAAPEIFRRLDFEVSQVMNDGTRRRFAFACPDWNDAQHSHLGGLLGAALCEHCLKQGWIEREAGSRSMTMTPAGREALSWLLHPAPNPL